MSMNENLEQVYMGSNETKRTTPYLLLFFDKIKSQFEAFNNK